MHWLQTIDTALLRWINQTLSNGLFDVIMPVASGQGVMPLLFPAIFIAGILLLWKGGTRGRVCVLMLALILGPGDGLVTNTIKHAVARPRPFINLPDLRRPDQKPSAQPAPSTMLGTPAPAGPPRPGAYGYNSMPSSHTANWFAATLIFLVYYRRSWRVFLPVACLVGYSRVYLGVHYPSDVLAGAVLGAGYAAAGLLGIQAAWRWAGRRWFPLWWSQLPSLLSPDLRLQPGEFTTAGNEPELRRQQWLRLGYAFIAALFVFHLFYLAGGAINLSGDEAYQWLWSKHLDLSYYSKPPMIAWLQFAGTSLWGDTELGVRFFSPVIGAVLGCLMLRFFARESSARTGFFFLLIITATPLLSVGSVLLTIDAPSVLFWTAATLAGWRAVQPEGKTSDWAWTGLWMGLGFLSKYTELFQLLCWIVFFWLCRPARAHLRRPGPWLALAINLACTAPVLVWNAQRHWVTVTHVAERAGAGHGWKPADALRYFTEFIGGETGVLNPVFFIAAIWAAIAFWRRFRNDARLVFLFSMSAPLFLAYLLWSFRSRTLPNWIVPSVIPAYSLMTFYWETRWREGVRAVRTWWISGLAVGLVMVVFLHNFDLTKTFTGRPVPSTLDPTGRLKGAPAMAAVVDQARQTLSLEGKPVFVIGDHYATSGLLSFYLPEARTNNFDRPLVYYRTSETPDNQFYFWPGYREQRRGENALFIRQVGLPSLKPGWYQDWRHGGTNLWNAPQLRPAPEILFKEFDSVTNLGLYPVLYRGRLYHTVQIFECRNLK